MLSLRSISLMTGKRIHDHRGWSVIVALHNENRNEERPENNQISLLFYVQHGQSEESNRGAEGKTANTSTSQRSKGCACCFTIRINLPVVYQESTATHFIELLLQRTIHNHINEANARRPSNKENLKQRSSVLDSCQINRNAINLRVAIARFRIWQLQ